MESVSFGDCNHGLQVGHSSGSIHAEIYLPPGKSGIGHGRKVGRLTNNHGPTPERPETPPSPLSTVPFPRDTHFITRDILLHQIHEKASVPGSRIALVGLGGVGKSQLAIEYTHQIRSELPRKWIFWIHAGNAARFEESFRDIADELRIPGRQDPKANIFKLVENWLQDKRKGTWICVLDNVDDDSFLCLPPVTRKGDSSEDTKHLTKSLLEYVPTSQNGTIIITSRSRGIALKMVNHRDIVEIPPMERSEALRLLLRTLDQSKETQICQQLVEELEFMPLAIVQAGSYIRERGPLYSLGYYLRKFQDSDCEAINLLRKEAGYLSRSSGAKNSILATWQISFDYIRRTKPSAADLLSLMSFFDRQGVPKRVLYNGFKNIYTSNSASNCRDEQVSSSDIGSDFEDDCTTLRQYSFISVNEDGSLFTMHRLVQLTTRAWLKSHGKIDQWKEKFISVLHDEFPTCPYDNWRSCKQLFPHVKAAMAQRPESPGCLKQWVLLLYRGAWYSSEIAHVTDTKEMASKIRDPGMMMIVDDNDVFIDSTELLVKAVRAEGRCEEAEQLELEVVEARRTKLGADHPSTLMSIATLALIYRDQGRWEDAKRLQVKLMEMSKMESSKTKLSEGHPHMVTYINSLALTYLCQNQWEEAEQLFKQAIDISKTRAWEKQPPTLTSKASLAWLYLRKGQLDEAERLFLHVIETRTRELGENHSSTLTSINNLASVYQSQGRLEESQQLLIQLVETRKKKLGENHADTLASMAKLALTYRSRGLWEEAERLFLHVIETRTRELGENHISTLTSINNLASMYRGQGRWKEAQQLLIQLVENFKTKLGGDNAHTMTTMAKLASTYRNQGLWEEAERLLKQVMATRKTKLGESHPDTLTIMHNLASIHQSQCQWKKSEHLFLQAVKLRKEKLGKDHPSTLMSIANLALTYRKQGLWKKAEQLQAQVVEAREAKLGANHPDTLRSVASLALTYGNQGRWSEAERLQVPVMEMTKSQLGVGHPDTLISMADLASTYWNQGRLEEAEELEVQVMEIRKTKLGMDHPDTLVSMANLAFTRESSGRNAEAIELLQTFLVKQEQILGLSHPDKLSYSRKLLEWETKALMSILNEIDT